jgi:hypothetical protein
LKVATLVARNANEAGAYGAVWRNLSNVVGRNLAALAVKMFSHLISCLKKFYKFRSLNVIFERTVVNRNTVQQKKFSFPQLR